MIASAPALPVVVVCDVPPVIAFPVPSTIGALVLIAPGATPLMVWPSEAAALAIFAGSPEFNA